MKKALYVSIIFAGFTAMAGQIIFIREFLASFSSDELSVGLILASWLITGAIGSFLLGKFSDKIKPGYLVFWLCQISLIFILPLGILYTRCARQVLQFNAGEIIPFHIVSLLSFLILLPLCAILGFMFSLSCSLYQSQKKSGAASISRVYALESFGSMAGGLLISFLLVRLLSNLQIISVLCFLNAAAGLFLILSLKKIKPLHVIVNVLLIIILIFSWLLNGWGRLDTYLLSKQWPGYKILASKNSIYGNALALEREGATSFFENGMRLFTVPEKRTSEEAVHFILLEHPAPLEVLLIGGGVGGLLDEILKHPIRQVDYVELDPMIVKMSDKLLTPEYSAVLRNPKVSVVNADGRYFIKRPGKKYDCIIVHLGDPYTAQLNRFYTYEFFREAASRLKEKGIISFYLNASENYISVDMGNFLRSIYATMKMVFPEIKVFPGDSAYFLASNSKGTLTYDYNLLMQMAKKRSLDLKYVREYYLFSRLSTQKVAYFEQLLSEDKNIKINYDFRPSAYYYGIISWAARFKGSLFSGILKSVDERIIWTVLSFFVAIFIFLRRISLRKPLALISVGVAGFSQSAIQVVLLFSFQIIYGYLFYKLGILFTFFMAGLAAASWWVGKKINKIKSGLRPIMAVQLGIGVFSLIIPIVLHCFSSSNGQLGIWFGANIFFPALSLVSGLLGGLLFSLSNKIYLDASGSKEYGSVAGLTYGFDLLGSCLGSALSAVFFIPILGIDKSCLILALLNFTVFGTFLFSDK